ncbi:MAG: 3-deoxy-7-phosphoheptulonate synthase [Bdellovibrionota bacterium]
MGTVRIGSTVIGGGTFAIIAGPCAVESQQQFLKVSMFLKELGVQILRGGIYKLRTDPNSFQGLREEAIAWLPEIKQHIGLPLVSEITDPRQVEKLDPVVDCYQVGTRNMYNYELLKELGKTRKPVILKRGFSALIKEWLLATEYLLAGGNDQIILCERGIRTFETFTRNTLDLAAVAYIKSKTQFPVIVDPSHAAGSSDLVLPLAKAAKAVGADGVLIEVHAEPSQALSDADQALNFMGMQALFKELS